MNPPIVQTISESFIKPNYPSEKPNHPPLYLTPWDLSWLSIHYIQKGLLFIKPTSTHDQENPVESLLEKLKESLSLALVQFYPLAGRLTSQKQENPPSYSVYIDCNNSPGAKFIYATLDLTIADILSPVDVPIVVQSLFDHDRAVNYEGHSMSLLSVQVTELMDGIFIGFSINHAVVDGTSYWNFLNILSNTFRAQPKSSDVFPPPLLPRWFPHGCGPLINLPFSHQDQFISRFESPPLRERIFHFSSESIAKIKSKANSECKTNKISSLQSVSGLLWRCITRARRPPHNKETFCAMSINNRSRMEPPLPNEYFGNCVKIAIGEATVGKLLEQGFGWAALRLHELVAGHSNAAVRDWVEKWVEKPSIYHLDELSSPFSVVIAGSPRFLNYENEFGMGKPVAIRSGYANKLDGTVMSYPGYEGGGSMDFQVSLSPEAMNGLESDAEFMDAVNS